MKLRSSFQARIACVLTLLLLFVIAALTLSVKLATTDAVRGQAAEQLQVGSRVFERLLDVRGKRLKDAAQLLAADFGFRDAVASGDSATLRSALANHGARIGASDMILLSMDGKVMASTVPELEDGSRFRYDQALRDARRQNQAMLIVPLRGEPHLLVEAPVMAPLPIGRVVVGFVMDDALAQELHNLTNLQVSFLSRDDGQLGKLVSTQPASLQPAITNWMLEHANSNHVSQATHDDRTYLSQPLMLDNNDGGQVIALLQSPLDEALQAFSALDNTILFIAITALAASLVGALLLARSVSQPVQMLAQAAARIGTGDYQTPVDLERRDELGLLAKAFNHMRVGIAEREQQLAYNALHDSLTGLPNRTLAMERLSSAIAAQRPVALVYLGIDNLRALSDGAGSVFIDGLLHQVGQRLQATLTPGDTLAHLIADEFLLLLEHTDSDNAVARADKIQQLLLKPHRFKGHDVAIDCRIGIAAYPADGDHAEALVSRAAVALKDASMMPGRLQVYEQGRDLAHQRQIRLIRDLRRAADNGELLLNYQPKLDIREGKVRQAEALLRWHHPQLGIVSPGEFIELAERTGSIQLLTRWVIEEGIRQLGEWNLR
ncbi:diguanylate cyclase, partial [Pseudomonas sp.]